MVFRSILHVTYSKILLQNLKKFYLVEFTTDWLAALTHTQLLTPSGKRNLITTEVMDLISSLFNVASSRAMPSLSRSSSNACIMVLPQITIALLCALFLSQLPCASWLLRSTWEHTVQVGALFMLFFAWKVFEVIRWNDQVTHSLFLLITEVCYNQKTLVILCKGWIRLKINMKHTD